MPKGMSRLAYGRRGKRISTERTTQLLMNGGQKDTEVPQQSKGDMPQGRKTILTTSHSKFGNKKILEADGTKSDSKLESYLKGLLEMFKIPYTQQVSHVLMPSFRYKGELIRQIAYRLDFVVAGKWAVETKGFFTPDGKMKWKMFLHQYGGQYEHCFVLKNKRECDSFVSNLLTK